jgi:hypothetical protein
MHVICMKEGVREYSVPFLFVIVYPPGIKHVPGKENFVIKPNEGKNDSKSDYVIGYH